ncbi:S8/S53 family peptidase [Algoriphagus sp. C2-6-M1]|uniref:S8 family peptidase n=1 Tax=Algoriphagus persicinus TaxID=3108754 RepID=UPI002B3C5615|nr:S8/S53 family peptidase [Algoriphagus sp. C2-6-M1]MEB2781219.1 S8/S53 family peptidase [Algoriphagus sp. C2-6-M1]
MKNLVSLLITGFVLFSCAPDDNSSKSLPNSIIADEQGLYNIELVFDESSGLAPLINTSNCLSGVDSKPCQEDVRMLKNQVLEKINQIDKSIQVDELHIRVYLDVSVYLGGLTAVQYQNLAENAANGHYLLSSTFEIQIRRPIMQTEYIQQARRPIMQEQLRYDPTTKTSLMIKEIGGGQPGSSNPTHRVWIVDTGIDSTHQDLKFSPAEVASSQDFTIGGGNSGPFKDVIGHGTFLAGAIGGLGSTDPSYTQGYGVNGVWPGAKMVSIKIFKDNNGKANSGSITSALEYILIQSVSGDIVNLSWGINLSPKKCDDPPYNKIYEVIDSLASKGVNIVMSAGNEAEESLTNFPGCINLDSRPDSVKSKIFTIGSVEVPVSGTYYYSIFSNYGKPSIDYLTPGEDVFTTAPDGKYVLVSGTSISAAIFSGILYGNSNPDTLAMITRGAAAGAADPSYPIAKVRN